MIKNRLDIELVKRGLVTTRSQAESYIRLGKVLIDKKVVSKPGFFVSSTAEITLSQSEQYVSRAGLKLASVAQILKLSFEGKIVLDVGSSTGGFTDYALKRGAKKVIAIDVGTEQLHPSLRGNPKVELHEKTNILDVGPWTPDAGVPAKSNVQRLSSNVDIVVIDVSFVSLRTLLPHIATLAGPRTQIVAMLKPQFEAGAGAKHKGVIKNDAMRRQILKDFEVWVKKYYVIIAKSDSDVAGSKGNRERFYLLTTIKPL